MCRTYGAGIILAVTPALTRAASRVRDTMVKSALFLILLLLTASVGAESTIKEFRGKGNTTTSIFNVESPWLLDWRLDGDYDALIALDITLIDARNDRHLGRVLFTKHKGNGVRLFKDSGRYKLRISSTLADWTVKIKQISDDEAKLYTPKKPT